jgi:biotin carboxyl carrier protein
MTNYEIIVNGKSYDVAVQKKSGIAVAPAVMPKQAVAMAPVAQAPATVAAPSDTPVRQASAAISSAGKKILAPMPGKIIAIKVNVGDKVKKGQELIIMEAMKMHNPILAANDGVITELSVQVNDSVQSGQSLISIGAVG